jgi:hypothetical protein
LWTTPQQLADDLPYSAAAARQHALLKDFGHNHQAQKAIEASFPNSCAAALI